MLCKFVARDDLELRGERASLVEVVEPLEGSWCEMVKIGHADRLVVARVFMLHVSNFLFQLLGLLLRI
jgi:hypothetical protein